MRFLKQSSTIGEENITFNMSIYTFKPDRYSSHMKIIRYLNKINTKRIKILDIGCSKGFIGKALSKKHDFYGIEARKEDIKDAKKYYKEVKIINIDYKKPHYPNNFFDVIIMADVIEHLKSPLGTILYFKKFLKNNGLIILSVPNIANVYVRLKLLFGYFEYEDRGILDRTHLKFFTLKSFRAIVRNAGLITEKEEFTPIPLPTMNPVFSQSRLLNLVHQIDYLLALLWKTMFSFQFIAYCRKI